jgi:indolepyruvate ferredoxin oxidoreductase, beta subunit
VFALMPTPGDVDVVLAAELMEAGRSVLRGLVTPERTTLIASTHRAFAVVEKQMPGDGVADPEIVTTATGFAAKHVIAFDMEAMAKANGSVISSTMFGALAAAAVLPFPREAFEAAVRAGGTGVEASLRAFGAAFDRALTAPTEPLRRLPEKIFPAWPTSAGDADLDRIKARIDLAPEPARRMLAAGARKLVDYLDLAYAGEYLDRIDRLGDLDRATGGERHGFAFTVAAAKY